MIFQLIILTIIFFYEVTGKCSECSIGFSVHHFSRQGSKTFTEKSLIGYNFSTSLVSNISTCLEACVYDCRCTSMNYKMTKENNGLHICALNYETRSSKPEALSTTPGYYYIDVFTRKFQTLDGNCSSDRCNNGCCGTSPCKNNGKCRELCEDIHRFNCTCTEVFEGRLCEKRKCDRKLFFSKEANNQTICIPNKAATSCREWYNTNFTVSGVYPIDPDGQGEFNVWCDMEDGGYTMIQRNHLNAAENFGRTWEEYKTGFGELSAVFWLGNEKIYRITSAQNTTLKVIVSYVNKIGIAKYETFTLESEENGYRLNVERYSGDAGDCFNSNANYGHWRSNGEIFSTLDCDNDKSPGNCALDNKAGWWFKYCSASCLNRAKPWWFTFTGNNKNVEKSEMKIIPN